MNEVLKSFRFRIYPTNEQKQFLAQQFGAIRYVYNYFLAKRKDEYLNNKKLSNYHQDSKELTKLKKQDELTWLKDINSQSLQFSLRNLDIAYLRFFKKQSSFPNFHKKTNKQSFKIPQNFKVINNKLHIPKLNSSIKINLHQELPDNQVCLFISKNPSNQYFASILCKLNIEELPKNDFSLGIDLGLKDLVITSEGEYFSNHKFYRQSEKQLAFHQRKLSRSQKGSSNRKKRRLRVAKLHQRISNRRLDQLHKITHQLINENQVIIAEDLSMKNMIKNHKLSKSIQDASWGELTRQLEYKAKWYGRTFHQIDRFFPSSKTCNKCKFVVDSLPLNIREWTCPICSEDHDRDLNAALNIREKGMINLGLWNAVPYQKLPEALSVERSKKVEAPGFSQ